MLGGLPGPRNRFGTVHADDHSRRGKVVCDGRRHRPHDGGDCDGVATRNHALRRRELSALRRLHRRRPPLGAVSAPTPDHPAETLRMSVHIEHRRRGLGRRIVRDLIAQARTREMHEVVVTTDTPWGSALA